MHPDLAAGAPDPPLVTALVRARDALLQVLRGDGAPAARRERAEAVDGAAWLIAWQRAHDAWRRQQPTRTAAWVRGAQHLDAGAPGARRP